MDRGARLFTRQPGGDGVRNACGIPPHAVNHRRRERIQEVEPDEVQPRLAGYDPAFVDLFNKAGAKTYTGTVGDFAHRPQLASFRIRSEGGVMQFANGNLVFYAVLSDEADPSASDSTVACVGWEAAKQWGGTSPGTSGGTCQYP